MLREKKIQIAKLGNWCSIKLFRQNNKVMAQNQAMISLGRDENRLGSKRTRIPSKHHQSIIQLAKMNQKKKRKGKNYSRELLQNTSNEASPANNTDTISCILPGQTKKLRLSILIKKPQKIKQTKIRSCQNIPTPSKPEQNKNPSLLHTFLQVCINLQADEDNKKTTSTISDEQKKESEKTMRENKIRKEKEDEEKYLKFYDRYRKLNDKLNECWEQPYTI